MHATATSKRRRRTRPIKSTINETNPKRGPCDPNNVRSRWPATIFAANRMANVAGRIILLTVSIITITGIRNLGVPLGTKWANRLLYWYKIEIIILPIQRGSESDNVIEK